jgi:hypothetical protein
MLAPSLATSWEATHRFNLSRSDSADRRRELSLGRAADPWRTTEAWNHHFERTVSRYLRGRPTTRSQTWRTFLANTFGSQTFISPVIFADGDDEEVSRPSIHGPTAEPAPGIFAHTLGRCSCEPQLDEQLCRQRLLVAGISFNRDKLPT